MSIPMPAEGDEHGTIAAARAEFDRGVGQYVRAIHLSRIMIAAVAVMVAIATVDEIPRASWFAVLIPVCGLIWMILLATHWTGIEHRMVHRPGIVWLDPIVLIGLMMLNKPWDSLIVLPYCSFVLLVPYIRPRAMVLLVAATTIATYLPKLTLNAFNWEHADRVPPVAPSEWLTLFVGPIFCGTVAWALCALHWGIRSELDAREHAERALMEARADASRLIARQRLANRLHETLSQVVRAIPLRLDGDAPPGVTSAAASLRRRIIGLSLEVRPAVQSVARELREPMADADDLR